MIKLMDLKVILKRGKNIKHVPDDAVFTTSAGANICIDCMIIHDICYVVIDVNILIIH